MDRFTEEELLQLQQNQADAEAETIKQCQAAERKVVDEYEPPAKPKRPRKAATHLLGAKPKPMPSDAPVTDKTGRVINQCAACGARWDDSASCSHETKNRRQFTRDGVERFQCFCEPMRMFERYKEEK